MKKMYMLLFGFIALCVLTFASGKQVSNASGLAVTAAAFGDVYNYNSIHGDNRITALPGPSQGDTWYSAWGSNNTYYMTHDDGQGFNYGTYSNTGIAQLSGDPNADPLSIEGSNLNPGSIGTNLPQTYHSSIYEVDGVLYEVQHYNHAMNDDYSQIVFVNASIIKSTDGGVNWYNHLGQLNTAPPDNQANSMFPNDKWGHPNFVQYGKGGQTPNVDNADQYVYLTTSDASAIGDSNALKGLFGDYVYLARIPRNKLADLNKNDIQYYVSGDGALTANWSNNINNSGPILSAPSDCDEGQVVYNFGLEKYVMSLNSVFMPNNSPPNRQYRLQIFTADHPWGPWTKQLDHGEPGTLMGFLSNNKWTTSDGKKMWWMSTGSSTPTIYPYGLMYHAVYFSEGVVDTYEAENAQLLGGAVSANSYSSYQGTGYATGFSNTGSSVKFTVNNINGTGWHIVKFRYASTNSSGNPMSVYVNGGKVKQINKLSWNDASYKTWRNWTEYSAIYYLNNGTNTFEIKRDAGDDGIGLMIDKLYVSRETTYDEGAPSKLNGVATVSSVWNNDSTFNAAKANDGSTSTRWNAADASGIGQWLQIDFGANVTVNKVITKQVLNRITGYKIQYWNGSSWADAYTGGLMGTSPKSDTFTSVTTSKIRLYVTSVQTDANNTCPSIAEFEVYAAPNNLAPNGVATASSVWNNDSTLNAAKANDESISTRWNAADATGVGQWVQIDFGASTMFNKVITKQVLNRITGYKIQYWNGSSWVDAYTGNLMGTSPKTATFSSVSSSKIRLYITSVQTDLNNTCPSIAEFEVYNN
ncbi:hypothetical protein EHS13_24245 [Paenibacillus psychroresistens]|uniref:DUF4185 domain-containing protein n=1 Tax=Paenibacillus psychroresistens TaxID=1778678 RepID=A0A6B8RQW9_9BACL|nr:discoidin domain-containing protein [Paenibacillus psychroresistens]QGQ97776.1 hypothetical protein EHS13_24245 [Paenibacillus psychroresistens]